MSGLAGIDAAFAELYKNGVGEAGLEVGSDPGLASHEYVQVPESMARPWVVGIAKGEDNIAVYREWLKANGLVEKKKKKGGSSQDDPSSEDNRVDPGTADRGELIMVAGVLWLRHEDKLIRTSGFRQKPPTGKMLQDFYAVNQGFVREGEIGESRAMWVHAIRFWSVVGGMTYVGDSHPMECVIVPAPTDSDKTPGVDEFVKFAMGFAANAFTACSARAGTWRKTNHATGGPIATGYARRWLSKMGFLSTSTEKPERERENRIATSAFYIATHASSVHATLALMAPDDDNHWAHLNPEFGLVLDWDIKDSARIRMIPNTQVAGGAMVADAVVVLEMMVKESISPLLNSRGQVGALLGAYSTLKAGGIKCAVYAKWFLKGHPLGNEPQHFDQKSGSYAGLIGELGWVARMYYKGMTIADSAALRSAAEQLGEPTAQQAWSAIGRERGAMSADQITKVYGVVKGGAVSKHIADMTSGDDSVAGRAIDAFNAALLGDATQFELSAIPQVNKAAILAARPRDTDAGPKA